MTQDQVADLLGVSAWTVRNWERGGGFTSKSVELVAEGLRCEPHEVLGYDHPPGFAGAPKRTEAQRLLSSLDDRGLEIVLAVCRAAIEAGLTEAALAPTAALER
jgi:transcriptional regulator with XRE-family HTH domain